jgi:hypothetical protein
MFALLHSGQLGVSDIHALKLSSFMGVDAVPVSFGASLSELKAAGRNDIDLVCTARTLADISRCGPPPQEVARLLKAAARRLFVYGFEPTPQHAAVLGTLSRDSLLGVIPNIGPVSSYSIERGTRAFCGQFAGVSFEHEPYERDYTFLAADRDRFSSLITIKQRPFLIRMSDSGCQVFLTASLTIPDIDTLVGIIDVENRCTSLLRFFSAIAPLMMFIRSGSRDAHWHNNVPFASLIIDDPLLRRKYGFVEYDELLRRMQRDHVSTSLAFIPWNHNRSDPALARRLAAHPDSFSLSIHGCDHTWGEFGSTDAAFLRRQSHRARLRMLHHERRYGIKCDPVMVFPQGIFSSVAVGALRPCHYLAAVNSTPYPIDREQLPLRSLLAVAVTDFFGFPLFVRREPTQTAELAFDLFLGKPALIVAHHHFFRTGYQPLSDLVQQLRAIEPTLRWASLETICSHAHLERTTASGEAQVQFYTDKFVFQNTADCRKTFTLVRKGSPPPRSSSLTTSTPTVRIPAEQEQFAVSVALNPKENFVLQISTKVNLVDEPLSRSPLTYNAGVFLRRRLSELSASASASCLSPLFKRTRGL